MRALLIAVAAAAMLSGCATIPASPVEPGPTYRAVGTEPFWSLELNGHEMVFTEANALGQRIAESQPQAIHGFAGDIYQGRRINLNIVHGQRCSDGMSDRIYPDKVQVRVDDRSFEGCGGASTMPLLLQGTNWSVVSVNGHSVPANDRYFVRFEGDRLSARFGCNSMSAAVSQDGARLSAGSLIATQVACPDMRDEKEAGRILGQPAELTAEPGDQLVISNAAGRIVLKQVI